MAFPDTGKDLPESKNEEACEGRVLVTGGTGLIGRQVVRILKARGYQVTTVSLDDFSLPEATVHLKADLRDPGVCMEVTKNVSHVFHVAGIKGSIDVTRSKPASFMVPMLQFNTNLLEAARINGVERLVYTSSIGAYSASEFFVEEEGYHGEPMDTFPGWAKRIAEIQISSYAKQYGLKWSVARPCNVYGPGDNFDPHNAMVIPSLMMKIFRGEKPVEVWGDGSAVRDFAFSSDVAQGLVLAWEHGTRGSFVNLGSGRGYSIRELVEALSSFLDFEVRFEPSKGAGYPRRVMDISRAREWLGYAPQTTLQEGLKKTWDWFVENSEAHLLKQNYFSQ